MLTSATKALTTEGVPKAAAHASHDGRIVRKSKAKTAGRPGPVM